MRNNLPVKEHMAFLLPGLYGGGAERTMLNMNLNAW
jgi:hypothetical protein